ncbi:MAG: ATP-binding protein [Thermoplasmata archaeon]|nr:ATP-binding protein [Candidatus Sysuiplasma acidicola]
MVESAESAYSTHFAGPEEEALGIVFGNAGTYEFEFVVTGNVERNEYVQVQHESYGWILGTVQEVKVRTDLSDEGAKRIALGENVQFERTTIGSVRVFGYPDGKGGISSPGTPVSPGTQVFRATDEAISATLGLSFRKNGAYVGSLRGRDIHVMLDIDTMVQKHISVIAKTGGGKSYLAGVIIEELVKNGVTVLILDPHGEYGTLRESAPAGGAVFNYGKHVVEFAFDTEINKGARELRLTCSNFTARELLSITSIGDSKAHLSILSSAIEEAKKEGGYGIDTLMKILENDESQFSLQLIAELKNLEEAHIFAPEGTKMTEIVNSGMATILNMKGAVPEIQCLFVRRILTALFELRKRDRIPPLLAVLEEAHNFSPQQGKTDASRIIRTIAAEGRKFGLGMMVITQRAAKVDKNVLSQCNTQFILRITNPNDLKAVYTSIEGLTEELMEEVPRLATGVCIGIGAGLQVPIMLDVRRRETKHGGESAKVT